MSYSIYIKGNNIILEKLIGNLFLAKVVIISIMVSWEEMKFTFIFPSLVSQIIYSNWN